mgnify:CR=1 FL=1
MKQKGMGLREALGHVVRRRPQVSPNPGFLAQLKEMEVELRGRASMETVEELPRREVDRLAMFSEEMMDPGVGEDSPKDRAFLEEGMIAV